VPPASRWHRVARNWMSTHVTATERAASLLRHLQDCFGPLILYQGADAVAGTSQFARVEAIFASAPGMCFWAKWKGFPSTLDRSLPRKSEMLAFFSMSRMAKLTACPSRTVRMCTSCLARSTSRGVNAPYGINELNKKATSRQCAHSTGAGARQERSLHRWREGRGQQQDIRIGRQADAFRNFAAVESEGIRVGIESVGVL
jgi:hypothetical protein